MAKVATQRMKPDIKKRWVKALRSGKFKKGKEYLHRQVSGDHTYCCLGVLCEVENARQTKRVRDFDPNITAYLVDGNEGSLTNKRLQRYGLTHKIQDALINKNDGIGWSFNRIANWIEKHL